MDGPFSRPTRSLTDQDRRGSPRFHDASFSVHTVLSDPAGVSSSLAFYGSLLVPSKFSTLSASGCSCHEAQSLHLRYGPGLALPTLSPCRYLHEPKARFRVGRLVPLAWAGISPAGSARLTLAHRNPLRGLSWRRSRIRQRLGKSSSRWCTGTLADPVSSKSGTQPAYRCPSKRQQNRSVRFTGSKSSSSGSTRFPNPLVKQRVDISPGSY
jgi:hypothetical protein